MATVQSRPWYKHWWGILVLVFLILLLFFILYGAYYFVIYYRGIKSGEISTADFSFAGKFTTTDRLRKQLSPAAADIDVTSSDDPELGSLTAPLTIVEFADFGCPYSREESFVIREFVARHAGVIRYIYRDFPIDETHPRARRAAEAGECAQELGNFWAYHDKLYQNQDQLQDADLVRYAAQVGLDQIRFRDCLTSGRYSAEVEQDYQAGLGAGVQGTPTFFINGKRIEGAVPREAWDQIFQALIST